MNGQLFGCREVLGYPGLVAVNHWESLLSRKAIAAVLLPKRFAHGCFAEGLAIGELVSGPNQDGVLSHREWTAFRLPRGSGLSWAGCSQPLGKSLSRKAIAAVLLPKRFDHGCSAGGLAIGERVSGPESRRSLEPP